MVKLHGPEEIAVVCYCDCRHSESICLLDKLFDPYCSVKQAVFRMQMEGDIIRMLMHIKILPL